MIGKKKAIEIAEQYVKNESKSHNLVILHEHTMEFELGWVFFYQTKEYVETRDILQMINDNAPLIINKKDGTIHITGTAYPIEKYIRDYIKAKSGSV
ncbi:MAG: YrhB domain-containing protein [Bacteroidota bacterium]